MSEASRKLGSCKEGMCKEDSNSKFVLGVDVGTTNIRCYVYDNKANVIGKCQEKVSVVNTGEGRSEIKPEVLWQSFKSVVKKSLADARLHASDVASLGISSQRGTFVTWDRESGTPFHNFITWKDKRADAMCQRWNASLKLKMLRFGAWLLYLVSGNQRFLAASRFSISSAMVLMRLVWVIQNVLEVNERKKGGILFGTIDTWLVWMLTGGKVHATDPSNASVTGFFDPYELDWSELVLNLFKIPAQILPAVRETSASYGKTLPEIFGSSISINALVGDQQSSMFGQCCFDAGDVNCTMGTGTFFDANTGSVPRASQNGVYPLVGWVIGGKATYVSECGTSDTGTIITWANSWGLLNEPQESSKLALSVPDNGDVYFLPPFSRLQVTKHSRKNESPACVSVFMGLKPDTTNGHLVRAILEAIIFQAYSLYESLTAEGIACNKLRDRILASDSSWLSLKPATSMSWVIKGSFHTTSRICGGVSKNDFLVQFLANLVSKSIIRDKHVDSSSLGAAFLAGLSAGVWQNTEELKAVPRNEQLFLSRSECVQTCRSVMEKWKSVAASCSLHLSLLDEKKKPLL